MAYQTVDQVTNNYKNLPNVTRRLILIQTTRHWCFSVSKRGNFKVLSMLVAIWRKGWVGTSNFLNTQVQECLTFITPGSYLICDPVSARYTGVDTTPKPLPFQTYINWTGITWHPLSQCSKRLRQSTQATHTQRERESSGHDKIGWHAYRRDLVGYRDFKGRAKQKNLTRWFHRAKSGSRWTRAQ